MRMSYGEPTGLGEITTSILLRSSSCGVYLCATLILDKYTRVYNLVAFICVPSGCSPDDINAHR